jgi:Uma2 family endonuclease
MSAVAQRLSVAEYLERDRASDLRHEFLDGETTEMTGGSANHSRLQVNLARILDLSLLSRPAVVYSNDMRVQCPSGLVAYPDLSVVEGEPRFASDRRDVLLNPTVLFEVLSPTTEARDRGEKFEHYRSIPSLREYVLVAQHRPAVEVFVRRPGTDRWDFAAAAGPEGILEIASLALRIPLSDAYAKVDWQVPRPTTD